MKIVKILISLSLFVLLVNLVTAHRYRKHKMHHKMKLKIKHKSHIQGYDASYSPGVIREFLSANIDVSKDDKKLLKTCLDLVSEDKKLEGVRKSFLIQLEKFAMNPQIRMESQEIKDYINQLKVNAKVETGTEEPVNCSEYISGSLQSDSVLNGLEHIEKMKVLLQGSMGLYQSDPNKGHNKLVTSFASYYRDSHLRHPDLFKRLNNKSR